MITNEMYFFKNQSSVSTSDFLYNVNDGVLILQVDGDVSDLELSVLGNTDLTDDDFVTLKTINASGYSTSDKITSAGIYWIDINGIRKIKLNLSKITGSVSVKAITKRGLTTDLVARAMAANSAGGGVSMEEVEEYVNNAIANIDGGSVTYNFAMTTELPELDYTVQETYDVELNQDDILQLEEFVNAYAKEKSILNVSVDGVVLWSFSNLLANIEMLDETNFLLVLENRFAENVNLDINGTFDGTKYTVTNALLVITIGDLDVMNEKITELENKPEVPSVFTESNFQPTEQPTGIYFMSDDTGTVEGSSGSASITAGTLYIIVNDDEYQSKLAFLVSNNAINSIEGRIKSLSGSINKSFYIHFSNFLKPGTAATIYSVYTFSRTPKCTTEPTEDTHLTNKKYVDDAIKAAITTALEGEY